MIVDTFANVSCRLHHVTGGRFRADVEGEVLRSHFRTVGTPIMMGGSRDTASKCLLAVRESTARQLQLLVMDPHLYTDIQKHRTSLTLEAVCRLGYIGWLTPNKFIEDDFYNLCLPVIDNVAGNYLNCDSENK